MMCIQSYRSSQYQGNNPVFPCLYDVILCLVSGINNANSYPSCTCNIGITSFVQLLSFCYNSIPVKFLSVSPYWLVSTSSKFNYRPKLYHSNVDLDIYSKDIKILRAQLCNRNTPIHFYQAIWGKSIEIPERTSRHLDISILKTKQSGSFMSPRLMGHAMSINSLFSWRPMYQI